ncbi:MAG TPA: hypothetical protein VHU62_08055 [Mycobacterium sp.]|jgi:predicted S18 family serine protease|nr:hypothetical protein [Mycobacterium sp.]
MKKLTLGLASVGAFAAITIGLAGPAMATPDYVVPSHDAVYSTQTGAANVVPVDCHVHVNYQGSDVDVNWC